jgi:hypothetical protein
MVPSFCRVFGGFPRKYIYEFVLGILCAFAVRGLVASVVITRIADARRVSR